ncbi:MAG: hypothetical protein ACK55I_37005, partial [bacterium]
IKNNGWIVDFAKERRILLVRGGDDARPKIGRFLQFGSRVGEFLPAGDIFGQGAGDTLDGSQLVGAGEECLFGRTESIEKAAQPHRSHLRDHVERDAGLEVIHGGWHGKHGRQETGKISDPKFEISEEAVRA